PYGRLVEENKRRGKLEHEFELVDTGVFAEDRYFDVFVEYAKGSPEDVLVKITAVNHGPERAELRLPPTVSFRDTWSCTTNPPPRPWLRAQGKEIALWQPELGSRTLAFEGDPELLFTENETNFRRVFGSGPSRLVKDGFHEYVIHGNREAVNATREG